MSLLNDFINTVFNGLIAHWKLTLPIPTVLFYLKLYGKKTWNLIRRPTIVIESSYIDINFSYQKDGEENTQSIRYPCFTLKSKRKLNITDTEIKINNTDYASCFSRDLNFYSRRVNKNPNYITITKCNNFIYNHFFNKHIKNKRDKMPLVIEPHVTYSFPFFPVKEGSHFLSQYPMKPLVFHPKNKIIVEMEINGLHVQYGINRNKVYEKCINYLAFTGYQEGCLSQ